jgi:hypothetical protein
MQLKVLHGTNRLYYALRADRITINVKYIEEIYEREKERKRKSGGV